MPFNRLGRASMPVTSVPMKLPSMRCPVEFSSWMPTPLVLPAGAPNPLMTSPRTVELLAVMCRPMASASADPSSSMTGAPTT